MNEHSLGMTRVLKVNEDNLKIILFCTRTNNTLRGERNEAYWATDDHRRKK